MLSAASLRCESADLSAPRRCIAAPRKILFHPAMARPEGIPADKHSASGELCPAQAYVQQNPYLIFLEPFSSAREWEPFQSIVLALRASSIWMEDPNTLPLTHWHMSVDLNLLPKRYSSAASRRAASWPYRMGELYRSEPKSASMRCGNDFWHYLVQPPFDARALNVGKDPTLRAALIRRGRSKLLQFRERAADGGLVDGALRRAAAQVVLCGFDHRLKGRHALKTRLTRRHLRARSATQQSSRDH